MLGTWAETSTDAQAGATGEALDEMRAPDAGAFREYRPHLPPTSSMSKPSPLISFLLRQAPEFEYPGRWVSFIGRCPDALNKAIGVGGFSAAVLDGGWVEDAGKVTKSNVQYGGHKFVESGWMRKASSSRPLIAPLRRGFRPQSSNDGACRAEYAQGDVVRERGDPTRTREQLCATGPIIVSLLRVGQV